MPNFIMIMLSAILFFLLVPDILFKIPLSSKFAVAAAHAFIYGIIAFFFHDSLEIFSNRLYLTSR